MVLGAQLFLSGCFLKPRPIDCPENEMKRECEAFFDLYREWGLDAYPQAWRDFIFDEQGKVDICKSSMISCNPEQTHITSIRLIERNISFLRQGMCSFFPFLADVRISGTQISSVADGVFSGCTVLKDIDLSQNTIQELGAHAFSELPALEKINLSGNRLKEVSKELFTTAPKLRIVNFIDNELESLPSGLLSGHSLLFLGLSENKIQTLTKDMFAGIVSLDGLGLSDNPIKTISPGVFLTVSSLVFLSMDRTQLQSLKSQDLLGLNELKELKISSSQGLEIDARAFVNVPLLEKLEINNTKLPNLTQESFAGLSQLKLLAFRHTPMTPVPGMFQTLASLEVLIIENSLDSSLPAGMFRGLKNLRHLLMSQNQLGALPKEIFWELVNLNLVFLIQDGLTSLPKGIFSAQVSPLTLNLSENQISFSKDWFVDNVNVLHPCLEALILQKNNLAIIDSVQFADFPTLVYLDLSQNLLSDLPRDFFVHLSALEELHLSANRFFEFPTALNEKNRLKRFHMDKNFLAEVPSEFFARLEKIELLDFSLNQLVRFPLAGELDQLKSLVYLSLDYNPNLEWKLHEKQCAQSKDFKIEVRTYGTLAYCPSR